MKNYLVRRWEVTEQVARLLSRIRNVYRNLILHFQEGLALTRMAGRLAHNIIRLNKANERSSRFHLHITILRVITLKIII